MKLIKCDSCFQRKVPHVRSPDTPAAQNIQRLIQGKLAFQKLLSSLIQFYKRILVFLYYVPDQNSICNHELSQTKIKNKNISYLS